VERDWNTTWQNASKLELDQKVTEAIALMEAFIRRNPNVADAHYYISSLFEQRSFLTENAASKRRDLESVAAHVVRAAALVKEPDMRFILAWKLARRYGPDDLNDPARAERYARELVEQHPTRAESYMVYAQLLREKGDIPRAAETMRQGRARSEMPLTGLLLTMQFSVEQVQHDRALSPEITQARLQEALSAAEEILAMREKDERDLRLATMGKGMVLELQAERVARDRQQRIALLVESERWSAPISEFKNGQPPPARRLSASQTAELEWEAIRRWNSRLADEGRIDAAVASHQAYLKTRPGFHPAHQELADLFIRSAEGANDPATRASRFEQAATELQRVVQLAPAGSERDLAFDRILKLYGPTELNQPALEEATARAMLKQTPTAARPHYTLAGVLFRHGKATGAEDVLRTARATIRATAASRAGMSSAIVRVILARKPSPGLEATTPSTRPPHCSRKPRS
jgi:tetratricopeptide (TPR) repeat protein